MRVFIAYASEQVQLVEPIVHALRNQGHEVFFDRSDLPVAASYDRRIQKAIERSDLFLFMVSPESVTSGHYARTELKFASKKWRRASGRVLPVLLVPTDPASIPAYLRSVVILEPAGNAAAETAAEVRRLFVDHRRSLLIRWAALAMIATCLVGLALWLGRDEGTSDPIATPVSETPSQATVQELELPRLAASIPQLVESHESGFLIGVSAPNELLLFSSSGEELASTRIQGTPIAVSAGPIGLFLATSAPNELLRLDPATLHVEKRLEIDFPSDLTGAFGEPLSRRPSSLAQGDGHLWLIARHQEEGAVLAFADAELKQLTVPEYYDEDLAFDLGDQVLESNTEQVWATQTGTTPASLYSYRTDSFFRLGRARS